MREESATAAAERAGADPLRLQILGSLRLWRGDVELAVPPQQALLLAVLLARAGRPTTTDELLEIIWGDAAPRSALNTLHRHIGALRHVLEPSIPLRQDGSYLKRRGNGYVFTVGAETLDLVSFRELLTAAQVALAEQRFEAALGSYIEALGLWTGPSGVGLDGGVASTPIFEALNAEFLEQVVAATGLAVSLGEPERVLPFLQLAASMGPLHEPVQASLISALGAAGRRAEALRAFHTVRADLVEQLGIDPGQALTAAYRKVLDPPDAEPAGPRGAAGRALTQAEDRAVVAEPSAFGDRLRAFRRAAGLTMEQLAEASGVSARAISDMERGHSRAPQARTLAALVDGLRLTGDDRSDLIASAKAARSSGVVGRPRLCEMPRGAATFVGRTAPLALARATASRVGSADGPSPVIVVHGQAGLGKTTFAVRVADELRESFPDGRLYLDLRGTEPEPMPAGEALHRLLRALGLHAGSIADTDDERSAQLRGMLRELRCLLVLDNAASEAQIRPLLAGEGAGLVVVTSRRLLGGLEGVLRIPLALLDAAESADLLSALAPQAADPSAAAQVETVSELCGYLPLALRIAGTRLASRPQWTVGTLADRLADADRRLTALTAGDTGVVAAFALSHAQLSPPSAVLFRRLALVPSTDFAAPLAAVLAETGLPEAEERLEQLVELGLLIPEGFDRYRFHDLIRLYAVERLRAEELPDDRAAAVRRMTDWLLETAIVAGRWYESDYGALPDDWGGLVPLATLEEAGAWLQAETDGWLAALRTAAAEGRHQLVCDIVRATYFYSDTCLEWRGWYEVRGLATAAAALPDRRQQAYLLSLYSLAATYTMRRYEEGAESAMAAHRLAEDIGDQREQARALQYAGQSWTNLRRFDDALQAHRTARELAERAGDHEISVEQLVCSGIVLENMGRYDEAIRDYRQALAELDSRPVGPRSALNIRSTALECLAEVFARAGRWEEALEAAELALPMNTEVGDTMTMGWALIARGTARAHLGRQEEAREDLVRGIELIDAAMPAGAASDRRASEARELLADLDGRIPSDGADVGIL